MPQRIEDTLLVVESFKSDGVEYLVGDRVPTRHRAIRRIAAQRPELFAMEWSTDPLDLQWLASIETAAEGRYEAVKRLRETKKVQQERALRDELKEQDRGQPELEKRYRRQQDEQKKREQQVREEREREALESQVTFTSGFNV